MADDAPKDSSPESTEDAQVSAENRRRDGRVATQFESLYSAGRSEGTGVLADISYSGALIEGATLKPEIGKPLRIYVFVQPVAPFELMGNVVRHTDNGFAIEYPTPSDEICRFVDDAAAIVNIRRS
jgi:hypothetical protein